jgi:adenine-specific DNA-methyltransferase
VDFVCLEAALVVELDGGIHADQVEYDARRETYLKRHGQVLRFWNRQVTDDLDRVSWTILSACRESDPSQRNSRIERGRRTPGR